MADDNEIEVVDEIETVYTPRKFYRLAWKDGKYGEFLSFDSGDALETEAGEQARGSPSAYFSLPDDPDALRSLGEAMIDAADRAEGMD